MNNWPILFNNASFDQTQASQKRAALLPNYPNFAVSRFTL